MELVLTEDQAMLAKTAREFFARTSGLVRLRRLRDANEPLAYSPDVWHKMMELGFLSMPLPEADGGLGLGIAETVLVTEGLGRELAPEPFVPCVVLAAGLLSLRGSSDQKHAYLGPALAGKIRLALAHEEADARGALTSCRTAAQKTQTGYRLNGRKTPVLGGQGASAFLVAARTSGAMLKRLERTDLGAELFTLAKVGERSLERRRHRAQHFTREGDRRAVNDLLERRQRVVELAYRCRSGHLDITELECGGIQ